MSAEQGRTRSGNGGQNPQRKRKKGAEEEVAAGPEVEEAPQPDHGGFEFKDKKARDFVNGEPSSVTVVTASRDVRVL
jgi:hypothetical protein